MQTPVGRKPRTKAKQQPDRPAPDTREQERKLSHVKKKRVSRARPPNPEHICWGATSSITGFLDRKGFRFGIVIQNVIPHWHVIGLVTRSPDTEQSDSQKLDDVLSHHAHQNFGVFGALDGEAGAIAAARRFLLEAPVPDDACACPDVGFMAAGPDP